jgi:hypothetical protein
MVELFQNGSYGEVLLKWLGFNWLRNESNDEPINLLFREPL